MGKQTPLDPLFEVVDEATSRDSTPGLLATSLPGTVRDAIPRACLGCAERLLPHLAQNLRLGVQLETLELAHAAWRSLLDALPVGLLLVGEAGDVLEANRTAQAILDQRDGLVTHEGRLRGATSEATRALDRACRARGSPSAPDAGRVLNLPRPSGLRALQLLARPLALPEAGPCGLGCPVAALFVTDPEAEPALDVDRVQRLYGLTPPEARVAVELARGRSLVEIATRLGVQENTVRWHLKQVFARTGTHRQVDLVRLLLSGLMELTP